MKRIVSIAVISVMILSALAFTACGGGSSADLSDSKYVGTWKATTMALEDETGDVESEFVMILNGDGTGQFIGTDDDGEEEVSDLTWELTDNGFRTKGDSKMKFTDDGDNIKTKVLGVELIFEKQ